MNKIHKHVPIDLPWLAILLTVYLPWMFQLTSIGKLSVNVNNRLSKLLLEDVGSLPPGTATSANVNISLSVQNLPGKLHRTGPPIFPSHSGGRDFVMSP